MPPLLFSLTKKRLAVFKAASLFAEFTCSLFFVLLGVK